MVENICVTIYYTFGVAYIQELFLFIQNKTQL